LLLLAAAGVLAGTVAALIGMRLLDGLLFQITAADPATFTGVVVALGLVALAACDVPARRASRTDPLESLRAE
jgi:ABC-type lipoprotein release transport system permease subunit